MARLLQVSTSGYYAHAKRAGATGLTPVQQRRADLAVKILGVTPSPAARSETVDG
jgi:hypothetical protein